MEKLYDMHSLVYVPTIKHNIIKHNTSSPSLELDVTGDMYLIPKQGVLDVFHLPAPLSNNRTKCMVSYHHVLSFPSLAGAFSGRWILCAVKSSAFCFVRCYQWREENQVKWVVFGGSCAFEITFKVYRWHMTLHKLATMYPGVSNKCWKCKKHVGSHYDMWWSCEKASKYWKMMHDAIQKMLLWIPFKLELF